MFFLILTVVICAPLHRQGDWGSKDQATCPGHLASKRHCFIGPRVLKESIPQFFDPVVTQSKGSLETEVSSQSWGSWVEALELSAAFSLLGKELRVQYIWVWAVKPRAPLAPWDTGQSDSGQGDTARMPGKDAVLGAPRGSSGFGVLYFVLVFHIVSEIVSTLGMNTMFLMKKKWPCMFICRYLTICRALFTVCRALLF
jgi:hypothetical protein